MMQLFNGIFLCYLFIIEVITIGIYDLRLFIRNTHLPSCYAGKILKRKSLNFLDNFSPSICRSCSRVKTNIIDI